MRLAADSGQASRRAAEVDHRRPVQEGLSRGNSQNKGIFKGTHVSWYEGGFRMVNRRSAGCRGSLCQRSFVAGASPAKVTRSVSNGESEVTRSVSTGENVRRVSEVIFAGAVTTSSLTLWVTPELMLQRTRDQVTAGRPFSTRRGPTMVNGFHRGFRMLISSHEVRQCPRSKSVAANP